MGLAPDRPHGCRRAWLAPDVAAGLARWGVVAPLRAFPTVHERLEALAAALVPVPGAQAP